ncbi:MAG: hypothetical protein KA383_11670 [Phycisphaerae bacterium]|nr:hypothetical protein [Phycisphaerae bacterium]
MHLRRFKRWHETAEEQRARLVAETSAFLTEALQHPELAVRIPMIPAGSGEFPPSLTRAFWEPVLFE